MALRSGNPTLNNNTFSGAQAAAGEEPMTLQGAVQKTAILLLLVVAASCLTWTQLRVNPAYAMKWSMIWALTGFVVGLVTVFKKSWAPVTAPIYAVVEGLMLGVVSSLFELQYPGIVIQAVGLTFGTLAALLVAYRSGLIKATQNFRLGVVAATGGICILYLVDLGMAFFGHRIPMIHESGWVGIGFSLFVVGIAALNLVLDFDFIERGAQSNQAKYMEWYAGFGLVVTLVWLYLEILRLLAKTSRRR
jgi:uncharacterized YccA/Bax inhibitor family protein